MARCPACGRALRYLEHRVVVEEVYVLRLRQGRPRYEKVYSDVEESDGYYCPRCGALVAETEEEAVSLLACGR